MNKLETTRIHRRYIRSPKREYKAKWTQGILNLVPDGRSNVPKGIITAMVTGPNLYIGWSLCHVKSGDHFKKEVGEAMALGRILKIQLGQNIELPATQFSEEEVESTKLMQAAGVPQSTTSTIKKLVVDILGSKNVGQGIKKVLVFTGS